MALFFRSQNVGPPLRYYDLEFKFEPFDCFAGLLRGCFVAETDTEGYVLRSIASDPRSGIEEIDQATWEGTMRRIYAPPPAPVVMLKDISGRVMSAPFIGGTPKFPVIACEPIKTKPVTLVQLGRHGDVINILPVAWALSKTNPEGKTRVVTARQYADVLEGCSYVDPVVFDGHWSDAYLAAVAEEKKRNADVRPTQVYFNGSVHQRVSPSFVMDSWLKADFGPTWWDEFPLVFDARNAKREAQLKKNLESKKPHLLYNFTGTSSPYPHWRNLQKLISRHADDYTLTDIGKIKAEKIHDLLGLMDSAAGLITIDTATLHLAGAARCPYIALVTDHPTVWHGSKPRGNCVLEMRYAESEYALEPIAKAIESFSKPMAVHLWTSPRVPSPDSQRRNSIAQQTWRGQKWIEVKVGDYAAPRIFSDGLRHLPYVKDMIDIAAARVRDTDRIVLTNADICCSAQLPRAMEIAFKRTDCLWMNRRDFQRIDRPIADEHIVKGHEYCGTDFFAFTVEWWKERRDRLPDLLYGSEGWDLCMRILMQESRGIELVNLIYHERHASTWELASNRMSLKSQLHNRSLARVFCTDRGLDPKPHGL